MSRGKTKLFSPASAPGAGILNYTYTHKGKG
jgi:hypothetical protein